MKSKVLFVIVAIAILGAAILGISKRDTYTDITAQSDYLDNLVVAVLPEEITINACEMASEYLEEAPVVAKVKIVEKEEILFGTTRQKVCVQKQYVGEGLIEGSDIYIYSNRWCVSFTEPQSLERSFINLLRVGEEYLVFLNEENKKVDLELPLYEVFGDQIIIPVFCYKEIENIPVETSGDSTYVEYSKVRDSEFFGETEKAVEVWETLKAELLEKYK